MATNRLKDSVESQNIQIERLMMQVKTDRARLLKELEAAAMESEQADRLRESVETKNAQLEELARRAELGREMIDEIEKDRLIREET